MKRLNFVKLVALLILVMGNIRTYAETYTINVGTTLTLYVPDVYTGYVDKAIWACSNPAISFSHKSEISATIRANKAFDGYATIELVYVEKYVDYKGFTRSNTYYKEFYVSCNGGSGDEGSLVNPTSVFVPKQMEVEVGKKAKLYYTFSPAGTTAKVYSSIDPGKYFNSLFDYPSEGYMEGIARMAGIDEVTVYFYDVNGERVSATCRVTVYDPTWITPQTLSVQSAILLRKGERDKVLPVLTPATATTLFDWNVDDSSVATISDGYIEARNVGVTTVTVKATNGLMGSCDVLVIDSDVQIPGIDAAFQRAIEMLRTSENEIVY